MIKRIIISSTISFISLLVLIIGIIFMRENYQIFIAQFIISVFLSTILFKYGPIDYSIYSLYQILFIVFFVLFTKYQILIITIFTFLSILNPLHYLEVKYNNKYKFKKYNLNDLLPKKIASYYKYRKKMKEYLHIEQLNKIINNRLYYFSRIFLVTLLLISATFISIYQLSAFAINNTKFNYELVLSAYFVVSFYVLSYLIYYKGYRSLINVLSCLIIPPFVYVIAVLNLSLFIMIFSIISLTIIELSIVVFQIVLYYRRVIMKELKYYDDYLVRDIYVNILYEDFYDNKYYDKVIEYKFKKDSVLNYSKIIKNILIFCNIYHIIPISYGFDKKYYYFSICFKKEQTKRKIKNFFEKNNIMLLDLKEIQDNENYFVTIFKQNDLYVINKIVYEAYNYKRIYKANLIILKLSFIFEKYDDLVSFSYNYRIYFNKLDNKYLVQVMEECVNIDYIIELRAREILLDSIINKAKLEKAEVIIKND